MYYLFDMDDVDFSVDGLVDFLWLVREFVLNVDINVIVYLMGICVFVQVLNWFVLEDLGFNLNYVFFVFGDLDCNLFVEWVFFVVDNMESVMFYILGSDVVVVSL